MAIKVIEEVEAVEEEGIIRVAGFLNISLSIVNKISWLARQVL
jgi:hypothetical protein